MHFVKNIMVKPRNHFARHLLGYFLFELPTSDKLNLAVKVGTVSSYFQGAFAYRENNSLYRKQLLLNQVVS